MTVCLGLRKSVVAMAIIVHLVAAAGADERPLRVGGDVTRPEKISGPTPVYTELAREARRQGVPIVGVVIIEVTIDSEGNVVDPHVLKGMPMGLDRAALDAVEKWKFKPATLHGKPVSVIYTLTVDFK